MATADPHAALLRKEIEDQIAKALARLTQREMMVIAMRNGLGEYPRLTHREIGERMGFSRCRSQQIEAKSMRVLRRSHLLDGYLQSGAFE